MTMESRELTMATGLSKSLDSKKPKAPRSPNSKERNRAMKYRELTPTEIEAYNVGYKVGARQIFITDIEWENDTEHKIYRKGYLAGCKDRHRNNVNNVNNVKIETMSNSEQCQNRDSDNDTDIDTNIVIEEKNKGGVGEKGKANETTEFHVECQNFDEIPPHILPVMKKYWTDSKIESIRKDLAFMSSHDTSVAILLTKYDSDLLKQEPPKPKKKTAEITNYGQYEYLHPQMDKWLDYKKSRGERYKTEQSLLICAKKLHELSGGNALQADAIVEQSIANNYAGLFPLKQAQQTVLRLSPRERQDMINKQKTEALLRELEKQGC